MLKNRLTYLFVVAILVLMVYMYEDAMTYAALYLILALPVASLILTILLKKQFLIQEKLTQDVIFKDEEIQYILEIKNNYFMPTPSLRFRFKANSTAIVADFKSQYLHLGPFKKQSVVFNISAKYMGVYEIGIDDIVLYDFLGLFRFKQKYDKTLELAVRPKVVEIVRLPLAEAQHGLEDAKDFRQQEDYSSIADLRQYQPTDGYKKIHWKASAKKNELISKNFQSTKRNSAAFVVENGGFRGEEGLVLADMLMEGVVSAISQCVSRNQLCQLYFLGMGDTPEFSADFGLLYPMACTIKFDSHSQGEFDAFLSNFARKQSDVDNVIIFVKEINSTIYAAAAALKVMGNNVVLIYFNEVGEWQINQAESLREMEIICINYNTQGVD